MRFPFHWRSTSLNVCSSSLDECVGHVTTFNKLYSYVLRAKSTFIWNRRQRRVHAVMRQLWNRTNEVHLSFRSWADLPSYFAISSSVTSFLAFDVTHLKTPQTDQSSFYNFKHATLKAGASSDNVSVWTSCKCPLEGVFEYHVLTRPAFPGQTTQQRSVPPWAQEPCRSPEHKVSNVFVDKTFYLIHSDFLFKITLKFNVFISRKRREQHFFNRFLL